MTTPKKISTLTVLNDLADEDYVVVVDNSIVVSNPSDATKRTELSTLKEFFVPQGTLTSNAATSSLASGASEDITIPSVAQAYVLTNISTTSEAWVVLYSDDASRTADDSRTETTDPLPGSGVIAEVITTTSPYSQMITPGVVGWTSDPGSGVFAKVVNKGGSEAAITVTLTYIPLTSA